MSIRNSYGRGRILPWRITNNNMDIIGNNFKIEGYNKAAYGNKKFRFLDRTRKDYRYQIITIAKYLDPNYLHYYNIGV